MHEFSAIFRYMVLTCGWSLLKKSSGIGDPSEIHFSFDGTKITAKKFIFALGVFGKRKILVSYKK